VTWIIAGIAVLVFVFVIRSFWKEHKQDLVREVDLRIREEKKGEMIEKAKKDIAEKPIDSLVNEHNREIAKRDKTDS
jgi:hypothetical protein